MGDILDIVGPRAFWVAVLRIATPLIFGTLGVLLCERAGVLNLGIEGIMVAGAFTGWLAVYQGAALWAGVLVAALTGAALRPAARAADRAARRCRSTSPGWASRCSATSLVVLRLPRELPEGEHAADDRRRSRADGLARPMPVPVGAQTPLTLLALLLRAAWSAYVLYRTPVGLARAHGRREPGRGRRPGHRRDRGAHRRHRRRLGADGRGRRLPHAVGLQRLLLQHGQRPRLDLRGAGGVRVVAAGQGAARRAAVRGLRRAAAAPAAERRGASCCPTRST